MERKILVEATIQIDGRYCGDECKYLNLEWEDCDLFHEKKLELCEPEDDEPYVWMRYERCAGCVACTEKEK